MDGYNGRRQLFRRNVLSTRRKMKVLSALDSDSRICLHDKSKTDAISNHGKEVIAFIQNEQAYIDALKEIKQFLVHPMLRGNVESLDDIIRLVDEMISTHINLCSSLLYGKSNFSDALERLSSIMDTYISYSILMNLELNTLQKFSELSCIFNMQITEMLHEPISQVFRYTTLFENLSSVKPNMYSEILRTVKCAYEKITNASTMRKSALRTLQIQRLLVKREPKILSPGRIVLKEGILYKVIAQGNGLKKRAFFLFSDILLCCKILSNAFTWQEKDSLQFSALFPLHSCSVQFVIGSSSSNGALFKVSCGGISYLLLSKVAGESQEWVQEMQMAIKACQTQSFELKPKLVRGKHVFLKERFSPLLKRTPKLSDSASKTQHNVKSESVNISELYSKKSAIRKLLKLFTCTQL